MHIIAVPEIMTVLGELGDDKSRAFIYYFFLGNSPVEICSLLHQSRRALPGDPRTSRNPLEYPYVKVARRQKLTRYRGHPQG
jgi:hypothetical protein